MSRYPKPRFFPVIHTLENLQDPEYVDGVMGPGLDHVISQADLAKTAGAHGVVIIPDYVKGSLRMATVANQFYYAGELKREFPGFLIGVNFLKDAKALVPRIYTNPPDILQIDGSSLMGLDREKMKGIEIFCGLAFKYSNKTDLTGDTLRQHCLEVESVCNVPTTSGDATGMPASFDKIREIRSYLSPETRLGLASGVTVSNIEPYMDAGVTDFLVATSLLGEVDKYGFDIFDPRLLFEMAEIVNDFS